MAKLKVEVTYGVVPNNVLNDKTLSAKAKGLFAYVQSKPDGWEFSCERISDDMADGRESVRTGLIELEEAGYLSRRKFQLENGQFDHEYQLYSEKRVSEKPSSDFPTSVNRTTIKERESKKENTESQNTETHVAIATAETAVASFGKEYVNGILAAIEEAHGSVDGKKQEGRQFAHLLAKKLEKGGVPLEKAADTIRAVIAAVAETGNSFIVGQTTSPKALYQNWAKIGAAIKHQAKKETSDVPYIPTI